MDPDDTIAFAEKVLALLQQGAFTATYKYAAHFLPWARVSLDAIENLVVADQACNGQKTDHLAASRHVEHWRARLDASSDELRAIADHARWESRPASTLGVARALYLPLAATSRLWSCAEGLVPADPVALRASLAA